MINTVILSTHFFCILITHFGSKHLVNLVVIPLNFLPTKHSTACLLIILNMHSVFRSHLFSLHVENCGMHFNDRLTGKMKGTAFKQFQLLLEIFMLCIHRCCPIHLVRECFSTRRENCLTIVPWRIPVIVLVWTSCLDHSHSYMCIYIHTYQLSLKYVTFSVVNDKNLPN
jgi:hypothetical protein